MWRNLSHNLRRSSSVPDDELKREREAWTWVDYALQAVLWTQWIGQPVGPVSWLSSKAYSFEVKKQQMMRNESSSLETSLTSVEFGDDESFLESVVRELLTNAEKSKLTEPADKHEAEENEAPPPYSSLSRSSTVPSYRSHTLSGQVEHDYTSLVDSINELKSEIFEKKFLDAVDSALDVQLTESRSSSATRSLSIQSLELVESPLSLSRSSTGFRSMEPRNSTIPSSPKTTADLWSSDTTINSEAASLKSISTISQEDSKLLDCALDFTRIGQTMNPNVSLPSSERLQRPIVIPQFTHGVGAPFTRAFALDLAIHNISPVEFLAFVDNLNIVATRSPPLALVSTIANLVSIVPIDLCQLASSVAWIAAEAGTIVLCRKRVRSYLQRANAKFFAPRGLKVECCSGKVLKSLLDIEMDDELVMPLDTVKANTADIGILKRRMEALGAKVAPLTFDVPPMGDQTKILRRLSDLQVRRDRRRAERTLLKQRGKTISKQEKREKKSGGQVDSKALTKYESKIARLEAKITDINIKADLELTNAKQGGLESREQLKMIAKTTEKKRCQLERVGSAQQNAAQQLEKDSKKEKKRKDRRDKELVVSRGIFWLVIRNIDDEELPDVKKKSDIKT